MEYFILTLAYDSKFNQFDIKSISFKVVNTFNFAKKGLNSFLIDRIDLQNAFQSQWDELTKKINW